MVSHEVLHAAALPDEDWGKRPDSKTLTKSLVFTTDAAAHVQCVTFRSSLNNHFDDQSERMFVRVLLGP